MSSNQLDKCSKRACELQELDVNALRALVLSQGMYEIVSNRHPFSKLTGSFLIIFASSFSHITFQRQNFLFHLKKRPPILQSHTKRKMSPLRHPIRNTTRILRFQKLERKRKRKKEALIGLQPIVAVLPFMSLMLGQNTLVLQCKNTMLRR